MHPNAQADNITNYFLSKEIFPGRPQYIMVSYTYDSLDWQTSTVGALLLSCYPILPKIRAENYFKESNWSTPIVLNIESSPQEGIPEGAIIGLAVVAVLIAVVLVVLIVLTLVYYWQRRKDKVVFLKVSCSQWCTAVNDHKISSIYIRT